ncbi:MAG: class I SAM-dependent methyltransferase [Deltaproteobacteria bacterium]|nr:class I SAM-dependent methyltransferase [Deltaproteobacteria bacterium]
MDLLFEQEAYWDKVAETKDFPVPFNTELFQKYVSKEKKVLEVGCGYGRVLDKLHNVDFKNLIGVDVSQRMINRGQRQYPYLSLRKSDGDVLPFPENVFHAVIFIAVLTCISESEKQRNLMSEALRVLKNDGILYVHDCMLNQDTRNIERYEKYQEKYGEYGVFELPEGAVVRHHTEEHIFDITQEFEQIVFEQGTHTTMNGNRTNGFFYIGKKKNIS